MTTSFVSYRTLTSVDFALRHSELTDAEKRDCKAAAAVLGPRFAATPIVLSEAQVSAGLKTLTAWYLEHGHLRKRQGPRVAGDAREAA